MFTNCYNSGQSSGQVKSSGQVLMVGPGNLIAEVGDIKTDFAHTIHFRERVSPIVNLFKRSVPVVIKLWSEVRGAFVPFMCFIKVAANVTICH